MQSSKSFWDDFGEEDPHRIVLDEEEFEALMDMLEEQRADRVVVDLDSLPDVGDLENPEICDSCQ